jgi:hypothetical protein
MASSRASFESFRTVLIVDPPLFGVIESLIGLFDLVEFIGRSAFVWMVNLREIDVRLFDFSLSGIFSDP